MKKLIVYSNKHGNKVALVDDEDFQALKKYKWFWLRYPDKPEGYAFTNQIGKGLKRMHRIIMKAKKGQIIDHINGNSLDNRKENLRFCSRRQNQANMRINKQKTSSKYRGVYLHNSGKWVVCISVNGKNQHFGSFSNEVEAAKHRDNIVKQLHGEFAVLNF